MNPPFETKIPAELTTSSVIEAAARQIEAVFTIAVREAPERPYTARVRMGWALPDQDGRRQLLFEVWTDAQEDTRD